MTISVPVLTYHQVEPLTHRRTARPGLVVDRAVFGWQMLLLRGLGYRAITLADLAAALGGQGALPRRAVVLTFDDGYQGVYQWVFPTLRRHSMTATLFLIAEDFDPSVQAPVQRAFPVLTYAQAAEMQAAGIELGSHTVSHARLTELSAQQADDEISRSRALLECAFGRQITSFCYPYGSFTPGLQERVAAAGYCCGATTRFGRRHRAGERYALRRMPVGTAQGLAHFVYRLLLGHEET